jgi:tRNA G10  N-methylase Trm11
MTEIDPTDNVRTVNLIDEIVELNPKHLQFNDANLAKFSEVVSLFYDYYSSKSAKAETLLANAELIYDNTYHEKFAEAKASLSDKGADAVARISQEVKDAQIAVIEAKNAHRQLKEYLRSFDKAHEMAKSRSFQLNKEMDKLHNDSFYKKNEINVDDILN